MSNAMPAASVAELAAACRRENDRFRRGEPCCTSFALELFRRAICERDEQAWHAIVIEYSQLIRGWARQHATPEGLTEDDVVNGAFAKFWSAVKPERWREFESLPAVLSYLKLCTRSLIVDDARARRDARTVPLDRVSRASEGGAEAGVLGELAARELWGLVLAALADESEQLLAFLSIVCEMKPREIQARHPARFTSVAEVYRVKRNVIERLRRHPDVLLARAAVAS